MRQKSTVTASSRDARVGVCCAWAIRCSFRRGFGWPPFYKQTTQQTSRGADGKWGRTTVRNIVLSDTYLGTFWWGKEKRTTATVSVVENGVRTYRKKVKREERPREEWTAIPVPDSGIPPETIYRARAMVENNTWNVSPPARTWELSRGVGVCAQCGSRLKTYSTSNSAKTKYFYYLCSNRNSRRENGTCPNRKHYPAETMELLVRDILVDAFREESWIGFVNTTCGQKRKNLLKLYRSDPLKTKERLNKHIDAVGRKEARLKELYIDGDISKQEYRERKDVIKESVARVTDELSKLEDLDGELQRIEHLRVALLSVESPLSGHYCFTETIADLDDDMMEYGLSYGSRETAARRRQEFYRQVGMRVTVGEELEISLGISLGIDGISVRSDESTSDSTRSPTGTP